MSREIRVAIAGVGNSASSLVQGIEYYRQQKKTIGLARPKIGPYTVPDIHIVAAFDIDKRKVGKDLSEAIFQERSEEHTSELQSRLHLVCRLLLEKKKTATSCCTTSSVFIIFSSASSTM